ncbi:MAG: hypothetical protein JO113_08955 [Candidatus Eremiobacteraeota bacterium]|nr:hypothetical protein [Candidatus Eremiobacteraeota bacterium]
MAIFVDLSAEQLLPDAVVALIENQASHPGPDQLLFKVSKPVHDKFQRQRPLGFGVTREEAREINAFAGVNHSGYFVSKSHKCNSCGRELTFYDIFKTGLKFHGTDYVQRFIGGTDYHIQVHKANSTLDVECTVCKTLNVLEHGCYSCDTYTYA